MDDLAKQMEHRHYKASALPIFQEPGSSDREFEIARQLYGEINTNYRHLADVRFKLLGLVPALSVLAWTGLFTSLAPTSISLAAAGLIISMLGWVITYGIRVYDQRNEQLYNDLISRGRRIEDEWGIHTGIFRGRRTPHKKDFLERVVNHGLGLKLIYGSVFRGWFLVILWFLGNLAYQLIYFQ
ncbi:MAG: hypothetical protein AAFR61_21480 [Bacteroidota bacterium]